MKRIIIFACAALFILPFTTGCETVSKGINNVLGRPNAPVAQEKPDIQDVGNQGTTTTTAATGGAVEQAIAVNLGAQISAVTFSIKARIEERTVGRIKGLIEACDRADVALKDNASPKANAIRRATSIARTAAQKRDLQGLNTARDILQNVR